MSVQKNIYRLVGLDGRPHPVLDTTYESFEDASGAAKEWSSNKPFGYDLSDSTIGIEVSTSNGSWRTINYS